MFNKLASVFSNWRKISVAFLIGILLLISVNAVIMLLRSRTETHTDAAPGRILYTTTFDAYQHYDWQFEEPETQTTIDDGELRLAADVETPRFVVSLQRDFSDMDMRINVKWLTETRGYISLRFRQAVEQTETAYYELKLDSRGAYRIEMARAGQMPEIMSDWQVTPFAVTGQGQINRIRIVAKAYVFAFYLNDQPLPLCLKGQDAAPKWTGLNTGACSTDGQRTRTELVEQTLDGGMFSIGVYSDSDAGVFSAAFDNLLIYGPR
jgi:hypothetical protein